MILFQPFESGKPTPSLQTAKQQVQDQASSWRFPSHCQQRSRTSRGQNHLRDSAEEEPRSGSQPGGPQTFHCTVTRTRLPETVAQSAFTLCDRCRHRHSSAQLLPSARESGTAYPAGWPLTCFCQQNAAKGTFCKVGPVFCPLLPLFRERVITGTSPCSSLKDETTHDKQTGHCSRRVLDQPLPDQTSSSPKTSRQGQLRPGTLGSNHQHQPQSQPNVPVHGLLS